MPQDREESRWIVVGVDGSPSSRAALRWAGRQAVLTGAALEAVTAWEYPILATGPVLVPPNDPETIAGRMLAEAVHTEVRPMGPVDVRQRVVSGHPAQVLIDAARDAQLLVLGRRGHGRFAAALLGSVPQHCIQHAPCPTIVVPDM